jgi:hypothetical protein
MGEGRDGGLAPPVGGPSKSDRWITGAFLAFLAGLSAAVTVLLFLGAKGWALPIALLSGAALWGLERLENRYLAGPPRAWNPLPGYLAPAVVISLVIFLVYSRTLNIYYSMDDFGYLHYFQTPSLSRLLRLFHTDIAQVLWGEPRQELRPFYGLYYTVSYQVWGLNPMGYHLSGILLHILNSLMVFLITKELLPGKSWRAGFAGLLFAVQPVHSSTLSLFLYVVADVSPTFFYLAAFLCFVRFRATGRSRYLGLSTLAFAGCLLSKEIAVTLPVMLVSYDLFRKLWGENGVPAGGSPVRERPWRQLIVSYLPFAVLLLAYLALRRTLFGSFLLEDVWVSIIWSSYLQKGVSGLAGLLPQLVYLGRYLKSLQGFNLCHLLLPFPAAVLGLVLGLYMVWALSLLRRRSECPRTIAVILYFGVVWYLISTLPLLAVLSLDSRYLYLPAVGTCIAVAYLVLPACPGPQKEASYLRFLGAVLLICISACQLWKDNTQRAREGEIWRRMTAQMAAALEEMPKQALVIIPVAEELYLPFALQTPFASTDFYSRVRIIEDPVTYCLPAPRWWEKTRLALAPEWAGASDEPIEIHLLAWDVGTDSLQRRTRVLPRARLRAYVTKTLGGQLETVNSITVPQGSKLVQALARLVAEGG